MCLLEIRIFSYFKEKTKGFMVSWTFLTHVLPSKGSIGDPISASVWKSFTCMWSPVVMQYIMGCSMSGGLVRNAGTVSGAAGHTGVHVLEPPDSALQVNTCNLTILSPVDLQVFFCHELQLKIIGHHAKLSSSRCTHGPSGVPTPCQQ